MNAKRMSRRIQRIALAISGLIFAASALAAWSKSPGPAQSEVGGSGSVTFAAGHATTEVPQRLSETGLYDEEGTIDRRNRRFSPQYPLWSDGASKSRWIYLPAGSKIDASDLEAWRFPVGTKLWKEFGWNGRKVETRMLWKTSEDSWQFASYVWNEDQSDATLAPAEGIVGYYEIKPGKRHSIPSAIDCNACHGSSKDVVLGFNALQLSDDRDPRAPHAESITDEFVTNRSLLEAGLLEPLRPELVNFPPRIRSNNPTERAALGYLSANCGGCHNSVGPLSRLGINLRHDVSGAWNSPEPAIVSAVDAPGRYKIPGIDPDSSRIVAPGDPARSALFLRMHSRRPSTQMPPLGTVIRDDDALKLVEEWIAGLQPSVVQ